MGATNLKILNSWLTNPPASTMAAIAASTTSCGVADGYEKRTAFCASFRPDARVASAVSVKMRMERGDFMVAGRVAGRWRVAAGRWLRLGKGVSLVGMLRIATLNVSRKALGLISVEGNSCTEFL